MQEEFNEKLIVREVLSGNRKAFVELIKQYEALVLHIVTPIIGIYADREDICQNIFIKVYEKLDTFRFKSKLGTWIGNIAYNTSINFLQKKKSVLLSSLVPAGDEFIFLENAGAEFDNPENIIIRQEDIDQLNHAIDNLPQFQRTTLLLFTRMSLAWRRLAKYWRYLLIQ